MMMTLPPSLTMGWHSFWSRTHIFFETRFFSNKVTSKSFYPASISTLFWFYLNFIQIMFWSFQSSVRPKFGIGIGNRNQGWISVSVSEPKLKLKYIAFFHCFLTITKLSTPYISQTNRSNLIPKSSTFPTKM